MLRKLFSSSFNNVGKISQISSLASTIHTLIPSASQKRMIVSTLKSTSESCANVLSKIEREEGFQISRSDLNRWTKLFEKQGQTQKSLQILRFKELKYLALMNHFKLCSGKKNTDPDYFGRSSLKTAASIIAPSVVHINSGSSGSGFIIDSVGTIITCAHVVTDRDLLVNKEKLVVTLSNGEHYNGVVWKYMSDKDVALVKIDGRGTLTPAKWGDVKKVFLGDLVLCAGSTLGLSHSFSKGVVSCLERTHEEIGSEGANNLYLQTDCAASQGNSGGPLVNLSGEVIGMIVGGEKEGWIEFALRLDSLLKILKTMGYKLPNSVLVQN